MPAGEVAWMCAAPMGMMAAGDQRTDGDALAFWAEGLASHRKGMQGRGCLRFAFYGRVSTEDWQDPVTSRARLLQQALMLVAGVGVITAEFFDIGESRELPWARRPRPRPWSLSWRIRSEGGMRS
jgi:site-specific DNA recombinase